VTLYLECPTAHRHVTNAGAFTSTDESAAGNIETALLLGSLRRLIRLLTPPHLAHRSAAYFRPSSEELHGKPRQQLPRTTSAQLRQAIKAGPAVIKVNIRFLVSANNQAHEANDSIR